VVASVELRAVLAVLVVGLPVLAGCGVTTQDQNERLGLRAKRTVESRQPVRVDEPNPDVRVVRAVALPQGNGGVVVVTIKNSSDRIQNDLPIEVGVGGEVLNSTTKTPYFQARTPVIAPGAEATWVFAAQDGLGSGDAFAEVGEAPKKPLVVAEQIPELEVSHEVLPSKKGPTTVRVQVSNSLNIPQYDLEVYVWAQDGGRIVAAGRGVIEHVGTDETDHVDVVLAGDPGRSEIQVSAPPTLYE
jgi:hypothetical protein